MARPSRRTLLAHLVSVLFVVLVGVYACARKAEALPLLAAGSAVARASAAPPLALASAEPAASASGEKDEAFPIDLAIAPQGGVPYHPAGSAYRSPFARPNAGPAVRIKVATTLNSIDEYDIKTGKFNADFYLSLTSTEPMPKLDLQFANGTLDKQNVVADKPTFKLYRMSGTFKSPADLRKYPFDSQELKIVIEDDQHGTDQIRFVVDRERTTLARGFRAVGWQVNFVQARSLNLVYGERFEGDDLYYGRYIISVGLERYANSATFKVFVPALVIVLISLLGMWVPPEEMEVRTNTGAPMLAAAVLFHYSLMQELPATSYFMRADKLMLGVYVSLLLGMISTWCMFLVKEKHVDQVFRISRIAVPLLVVLTMTLACLV
jgi:hypothetical protein